MIIATRAKKSGAENKFDAEFSSPFSGHIADLKTGTDSRGITVEDLLWKRPQSGFHAIMYRASGSLLLVTGDADSALYRGSEAAPLAFWAECNIDYFAGKCVASPYGRGFKVWSPETARASLTQLFVEIGGLKSNVNVDDIWAAVETKHEWHMWLDRNGQASFGNIWWELGDVGMAVDIQCHFHLEGLKRAIAQLRERAVA